MLCVAQQAFMPDIPTPNAAAAHTPVALAAHMSDPTPLANQALVCPIAIKSIVTCVELSDRCEHLHAASLAVWQRVVITLESPQ